MDGTRLLGIMGLIIAAVAFVCACGFSLILDARLDSLAANVSNMQNEIGGVR